MAAGNKKKKKPAANPARGFATKSTQSKSKVESVKASDSTDASGAGTPSAVPTPGNVEAKTSDVTDTGSKRELQDLSPEEFEAHLETSELQQVVEKYAVKVRKEASRQVSRLKTDKRLLRGYADFLSVKDWLPDELMQQIIDLTLADLTEEDQSRKQTLPVGDDLLAKVWTLRTVLLGLDIPLERSNAAIGHILEHSPSEVGQIWGLEAALDWLALHAEPGELTDYDAQGRTATQISNGDLMNASDSEIEQDTEASKHDSPQSNSGNNAINPPVLDSIDVSDVESDLEPDELLSIYLQTKTRLHEIAPDHTGTQGKKEKKATSSQSQGHGNGATSIGEKKLRDKLKKIERDVLFDQQEADAQWAEKRVELAKGAAERRKFELPNQVTDNRSDSTSFQNHDGRQPERVAGLTDIPEQHLGDDAEASDDGDVLSGMFDHLPGVKQDVTDSTATQDVSAPVTIRDFGRVTGMTPRRVLEENCRSRDPRCKIVYKQVSPTTYSCRHLVSIDWTKDQEIPEVTYLSSVSVKRNPRHLTITMVQEATIDVQQSEAYVATAALFIIFSHSPKEEKSHLRLPVSYRDLWDSFAMLKTEHADAADRETVKELRELIDSYNTTFEDGDDDEVVFNASSRRLNGTPSGIATPTSRPLTPRPGGSVEFQTLRDLWTRKATTPAYQRMLLGRMNLPMFHSKPVTLETIMKHQVTIVVGDTGSGKSTQVPQFILEHELSQGRQCKIYCTEPRRISAVSLAQRVSEELGEHRGDVGTARSLVGYAIRLESQTTAQTKLIYATVGIVLRMLENADGLSEITHLVLDEVHERSIDTDFLLIVLQTLITKRPDLKVVLMSATVDAHKFSQYLGGAPIITVSGRTFPVEARFLEDAIELTGHLTNESTTADTVEEADDTGSDSPQEKTVLQSLEGYSKRTISALSKYDEYAIDHELIVKILERVSQDRQYNNFSRAVLIFMPGIAEIRQLHDILLSHPLFAQGWRIHALHSTFSSEDQQSAFEITPPGVRKIIIATNIAETGITIPDVTCVIDTGKHREMRFDERRQISRLIQSFVARANAKQRRGRAGRVQEGICFHLFTKHRFNELMVEQQTPEMLRLSLQELVMRVKICKLGNIEHALAQALDPPSPKNVRRAIDALIEVGALDDQEQLTPLGSQLAKLPLDSQLGKLVLFGAVFGCLDFVLTVAATLTSKSPFLAPLHAKKQADTVRLGFKRGDSDLLTLYNAYDAWRKVCTTPSMSEFQFCKKNFLSPQNLANIEDLKGQLLTALTDAGFVNLRPEDRAALSKVRPGSRQRNFITLPEQYTKADDHDILASSVVAWSLYPKVLKQEGKGWRNIANNQSLGLHPTSVNKGSISSDVKYLSFYSIMQSSSKFTNAQETSAAPPISLALLAGDAVFHMYAGVIIVDGNRLRFKVRDWRTMIVLKTLRAKLQGALGRVFKFPGKGLGDRERRWMEIIETIFDRQRSRA